MTDTRKARENAVERLNALLRACSEPRFMVVPGGVHRLPENEPVLTYWYGGEVEKARTVGGNVMVDVLWNVRCMWRPASNEIEAMRLEMEMWHATRNLFAQLESDNDLGGNVSKTEIGLATTGELVIGEGENAPAVRTLEFGILMQELEAEEVEL